MKLSNAITSFIRWGSGKYAPSTITTYSSYLWRFYAWKGECDIQSLTEEDIVRYSEHLRKGNYHTRTVSLLMVVLRVFIRYLFIRRLLRLDPALVPVPRYENTHFTFASKSDVDRILKAIPVRGFQNLRDKTLISFLWASGLRVRETASLTWDTLDFEKKTGQVITRKNLQPRPIFWDARTHELFLLYYPKWKTLAKDSHVFISTDRNPRNQYHGLSTRSMQRILKERREEVGITRALSPHSMRHGFAMNFFENETNLRVIQRLLGHSHLSGLESYLRVREVRLKKAYDKVYGR